MFENVLSKRWPVKTQLDILALAVKKLMFFNKLPNMQGKFISINYLTCKGNLFQNVFQRRYLNDESKTWIKSKVV